MELPTYTSIWRIEKRLYKLYDFRLPMPLPVGQLAVFAAITVPYIVILTLFGLPFNHNLFWLYVLPPGLLTWLATRPVLESKRLPELIISHARYLAEPASWCRMAPDEEADEFFVVGRVWRRLGAAPDLAVVPEPSPRKHAVPEPSPATQIAAAQAAAVQGRTTQVTAAQVTATQGGAIQGGATQVGDGKAAGPPAAAATGAGTAVSSRTGSTQVRRPQWPQPPAPVKQSLRAAEGGHWPAAQGPEQESTQRASHVTGPVASRQPRWPAAPAPAGADSPEPPAPRPSQPTAAASAPAATSEAAAPAAERPAVADKPAQTPTAEEPAVEPPAVVDKPAEASAANAPSVETSAAEPPTAGPPAVETPAGTPTAGTPAVVDTPAASAPAAGVQALETPVADTADGQPPAAQPSASDAPAAQPAAPPAPTVMVVPAQRSLAGDGQAPASPPRPAPTVERALGGPHEQRVPGWRSHVTVVPGGRGPGQPNPEAEAKARAMLPLHGPHLAVVLGCTVGAGQTVTALMLAALLAEFRGEPVAALDLNLGPASLAEIARLPAISASTLLTGGPGQGGGLPAGRTAGRAGRGRGRLDIVSADAPDSASLASGGTAYARLFQVLRSRYALTLADPGAAAVAGVLAAADQLVLVAPASPDAARAVGMTLEWLDANGFDALRARSVMVLNGVSQRSQAHAVAAEAVVRGCCRAIVRVPWDDHLAEPATEQGIRESLEAASTMPSPLAQLRPAVRQAYTALSGVVVTAMAESAQQQRVAR